MAGPEREGSGAFQPTRKVANAIARIVVEGIASDTKAGENGESMAVGSLLRSLFSQSADRLLCSVASLSERRALSLFGGQQKKSPRHDNQLITMGNLLTLTVGG